ncbi:MAG: phosphatidate cytidylyltransferase [Bacteroidales bacterium]|nr:phosphatidate cytidylyltransferase [Bacteroidales bacterium]
MPNILKRTIFGALFVAVTCFMVLYNEHTCAIYIGFCTVIMLHEFMKMFKMSIFRTMFIETIGTFAILTAYWGSKGFFITAVPLLALILSLFIIQLFEHDTKQEERLGKSFLALIYIALPLSLATYIGMTDNQLIMAVFILIWISDTMAYLVGCKFGKHKIFERISPKKSWEGAIGGFVFTITAAAFGGYLFPKLGFEVWQWCVIGATVGVFAILGDFIESMFKRSAGVKDSGNLIPGHGGLLDRLDSFIFTIPWVTIAVWVMRSFNG